MSFNILDAAKSYLTPGLIAKTSSFLMETEIGISKALSGLIPIVLSGFSTKANSGSDAANDILITVRNTYKDGAITGIEELISKRVRLINKNSRLMQSVFDDKFDKIIDAVSAFAGVKKSSANSLFSLAGVLVGSLLGKFVVDLNMNSSGLSSFLHGQKVNIMSMLPAGLSGITSLLGISEIGESVTTEVKYANRYANETNDKRKHAPQWFLWLLVILIVALALWFFAEGKEQKKERANNNFEKL